MRSYAARCLQEERGVACACLCAERAQGSHSTTNQSALAERHVQQQSSVHPHTQTQTQTRSLSERASRSPGRHRVEGEEAVDFERTRVPKTLRGIGCPCVTCFGCF